MRIHIKLPLLNKTVYGALNFDILKFIGENTDGKLHFLVHYKGQETIGVCDLEMAIRIKERLEINGFNVKAELLHQAIRFTQLTSGFTPENLSR